MAVPDLEPHQPTTNPTTKSIDATTPLLSDNVEAEAHQPQPSSELYGYFFMALSTLGFSGMSLFTHIAEKNYAFPALSAIFIRATMHTVFSSLYMARFLNVREMLRRLTPRQRKLLMFRGLIGSCGMICVFIALQKLPVGDAVSGFFCNPVITMLLSAAVLGEAITGIDCLASVLSFAGILLIARPGFNDADGLISDRDRIIGSVADFAGAFLSAIAYVIVRSLGTGIHFMSSVFALSCSSVFLSVSLGGFIGPAGLLANKEGTLFITVGALFAFAGQSCMNKGLQHCRAGPGTLIQTLDIPVAYVLGMLFLGEAPSWFSFTGACLVITAAVMIALREMMRC